MHTNSRWISRVSIPLLVLSLACWMWMATTANAEEEETVNNALINDKSPAAKAPVKEIEVTKDVQYGTAGGEPLLLNLASPKGLTAPTPVVVWIHGGAWQGGTRNDFNSVMEETAKRGYVSASIGYRLAPKHVFPAQIEDCKCAIRWLRANAERLHIDPNRVGVVGGSAGAHLAMLLGTMGSEDGLEGDGGSPDASSRVQVVVSFAGPTDLLAELPTVSQPLLATFLGGPQPEKQDAARRASPITYIDKSDPPMLLVQGTKDPLVPHEQAIRMVEAMTKAGVPGRVELMIGEGHGWPKENSRVMKETFEFLDRYLK